MVGQAKLGIYTLMAQTTVGKGIVTLTAKVIIYHCKILVISVKGYNMLQHGALFHRAEQTSANTAR